MTYEWLITVPADTSEANPTTEQKAIHTGVITKCKIFMPKGCHGYVKASICYRQTQLLPFNSKGGVQCNGYEVEAEPYFKIIDPQPKLTLRCWSPDSDYEHDVTFRVTILPEWIASLLPLGKLLSKVMEKIFGWKDNT